MDNEINNIYLLTLYDRYKYINVGTNYSTLYTVISNFLNNYYSTLLHPFTAAKTQYKNIVNNLKQLHTTLNKLELTYKKSYYIETLQKIAISIIDVPIFLWLENHAILIIPNKNYSIDIYNSADESLYHTIYVTDYSVITNCGIRINIKEKYWSLFLIILCHYLYINVNYNDKLNLTYLYFIIFKSAQQSNTFTSLYKCSLQGSGSCIIRSRLFLLHNIILKHKMKISFSRLYNNFYRYCYNKLNLQSLSKEHLLNIGYLYNKYNIYVNPPKIDNNNNVKITQYKLSNKNSHNTAITHYKYIINNGNCSDLLEFMKFIEDNLNGIQNIMDYANFAIIYCYCYNTYGKLCRFLIYRYVIIINLTEKFIALLRTYEWINMDDIMNIINTYGLYLNLQHIPYINHNDAQYILSYNYLPLNPDIIDNIYMNLRYDKNYKHINDIVYTISKCIKLLWNEYDLSYIIQNNKMIIETLDSKTYNDQRVMNNNDMDTNGLSLCCNDMMPYAKQNGYIYFINNTHDYNTKNITQRNNNNNNNKLVMNLNNVSLYFDNENNKLYLIIHDDYKICQYINDSEYDGLIYNGQTYRIALNNDYSFILPKSYNDIISYIKYYIACLVGNNLYGLEIIMPIIKPILNNWYFYIPRFNNLYSDVFNILNHNVISNKNMHFHIGNSYINYVKYKTVYPTNFILSKPINLNKYYCKVIINNDYKLDLNILYNICKFNYTENNDMEFLRYNMAGEFNKIYPITHKIISKETIKKM